MYNQTNLNLLTMKLRLIPVLFVKHGWLGGVPINSGDTNPYKMTSSSSPYYLYFPYFLSPCYITPNLVLHGDVCPLCSEEGCSPQRHIKNILRGIVKVISKGIVFVLRN